ncbi:hypothetical protein BJY52DRAFT_654934 [Lactarius psammicola]|nr:hypothetical protein BJY52DRAFT_654934 [Lactarius psammicola]
MHSVLLVIFSLFCLYLLQTLLELRRAIRNIGHLSGHRLLLDPTSFLGQVVKRTLPSIPYVSRKVSWIIRSEYQDFAAAGKDATSMTARSPCFPGQKPSFSLRMPRLSKK